MALLKEDFPNLEIIKLEQNYRSTRRILHAANTLIANNAHIFEKKLWSDLGYGDPIRIIRVANEEAEAEQIVSNFYIISSIVQSSKITPYSWKS